MPAPRRATSRSSARAPTAGRSSDTRSRRATARSSSTPRSARARSGSTAPYHDPAMALPAFAASTSDRALAGVCGGIARELGVDVTLVRLVFALLALAGGAGIVLYLALWLYADGRPVWLAGLGVVIAGSLLLHAIGLSDRAVAGIALVSAGLAVAWRRGGGLRPEAPLSYAGYALVGIGAVILLAAGGDAPAPLLAPGAVAGGLLLIAGPWLWRLAVERDAERAARIRSEERSDVAARVHDSVLQTLALIQRHSDEPRRVASLARRQEREIRGWLYADRPLGRRGAVLGGRRRRGRLRGADRARELGRRGGRRRDRARGPRGDDQCGEVRERRGDRRLRGGHGERDRGVRPGPRRRLRPGCRPRGSPRHRRVDPRAPRACRRLGVRRLDTGRGHRGRASHPPEHLVSRRVVLVDDHGLFLAGVKSELGDAVEVVGEAGTVAAAIPLIKELEPEVVLLDVHLPDGSGEAIIDAVAPERPDVRFLALSVSDAAEDVIAIIRAGARGYVTKTISGEELAAAIERVASGDAVFSPRLAGFVLDAYRSEQAGSELDELTPREREVLQLIARGYLYKEIAARLDISVKTVESHVSSVLRKLQLSTRHELTRWATQHRLV